MYGFGYSLSAPELHYFVISKGGMVKEDFLVTLQDPTMQHDFAMTEDYVIFLDFPLIGNPEVYPHHSIIAIPMPRAIGYTHGSPAHTQASAIVECLIQKQQP